VNAIMRAATVAVFAQRTKLDALALLVSEEKR
jgi:hypothetical protein